jgi:hypothetical protein
MIGRGGMGMVLKGHDEKLQRVVVGENLEKILGLFRDLLNLG